MLAQTFLLFAHSTPALAGEAEITLKGGAASLALALAELDPEAGWIAVEAEPDTAAAKAKADILIESLADGTVAFSYDPALPKQERWGSADRGTTSIYAVDAVVVDGGTGVFDVLVAREPAELASGVEAVWDEGGAVCLVVIDSAGAATLVLPSIELGVIGVEPDEID